MFSKVGLNIYAKQLNIDPWQESRHSKWWIKQWYSILGRVEDTVSAAVRMRLGKIKRINKKKKEVGKKINSLSEKVEANNMDHWNQKLLVCVSELDKYVWGNGPTVWTNPWKCLLCEDWCHEDFNKQTGITLSDRSYRAPCLWQRSESKSNQNIKILPSTTQYWGVILLYAATEHIVQLVLDFLHY